MDFSKHIYINDDEFYVFQYMSIYMSIGLLHSAYGTIIRDSYLARDNHHQWPHFISYFEGIMFTG